MLARLYFMAFDFDSTAAFSAKSYLLASKPKSRRRRYKKLSEYRALIDVGS